MIEFESMVIEKHLVFDKLVWEINKHPLVTIRGEDRDAQVKTSNGVGKSLLPSTLTTILTDAPPIAIKKKSAKDLVKEKAKITLSVKNDNTHYLIEEFAKAQSVRSNITIDGVAQDVKDIKQARKVIEKAVPLSEDHIYSQLYVSSYRPSVLLYGSASTRLAYFEKIFDVRIYDQLQQAVATQLKAVNRDFIQNKLLTKQLEELEPAVAKNVQNKLHKLQQRYENLLQQHSLAQETAKKLIAYVSIAEQLSSTHTVAKLQQQIIKHKEKVKYYSDLLKTIQSNNATIRAAQANIKQRQNLKKQLKQLHYLDIGSKRAKLQKQLQIITKQLDQYNEFESHIDKYHRLHKTYAKLQIAAPEIIQTKLGNLTFQLKQKKQLQNKKHCPLCQQKITVQHKHEFSKLKKSIKQNTKRLEQAKICQYLTKVQSKVPGEILQLDKTKQRRKLDAIKQSISELDQQLDTNQNVEELKYQLNNTPKLDKNVGKYVKQDKLEKYTELLEEHNQKLFSYKNDLLLLEKLNHIDLQPDSLKAAQRSLLHEQNIVSQLTPQLKQISKTIESLIKEDADYISAARQIKAIENQLTAIEESIVNRDVLEALSKAYSNRGIRLLQIEALAEAYVGVMNQHKSSLYAKPVKFIANIEPGKFDIIADRGTVGDVRSFSGAESRQFLGLSALSLIALMPSNLRSNLLVLDELEAGLSAVNRKKFCNDFVPLLQKYVKNLVIITPHMNDDFFIPNAVEQVLVKENGVTTWKE